MPTSTFSVTSAGNDGTGWRQAATWAGISAGTFVDYSNDASNELYISKELSDQFYASEAWLRFDTSTIPSTATITSANLIVYCVFVQNLDNFDLVGDYYDFGGEPPVAADWVLTASPTILTIGLGSFAASSLETIALTSLTGIMRSGETNAEGATGITGIRLTIYTPATNPDDVNVVTFASFEHASQEPRLEVTYTEAAGPEKQSFYASRRRMVSR